MFTKHLLIAISLLTSFFHSQGQKYSRGTLIVGHMTDSSIIVAADSKATNEKDSTYEMMKILSVNNYYYAVAGFTDTQIDSLIYEKLAVHADIINGADELFQSLPTHLNEWFNSMRIGYRDDYIKFANKRKVVGVLLFGFSPDSSKHIFKIEFETKNVTHRASHLALL